MQLISKVYRDLPKYMLIFCVILILFTLTGCSLFSVPDESVKAGLGANGFEFNQILVWPMAGLMWVLGKSVAFGNFGVVIILSTIIVRTCAWPIYAKTNDMSLKMKLMQPEQAKIQARYQDKDDPESKQRMQMEMMTLYKKYGVGIGGCLMPVLQFPIFIGFYSTLRIVPYTLAANGITHGLVFDFLNMEFLGLDLRYIMWEGDATGWQLAGAIIIAALVGLTQLGSQIIMSRRQKKAQQSQYENVPEYRRPPVNPTQKNMDVMMKVMMFFMTAMMVYFVVISALAVGLYWLVGNVFSFAQSTISHKLSKRRTEKLKQKIVKE